MKKIVMIAVLVVCVAIGITVILIVSKENGGKQGATTGPGIKANGDEVVSSEINRLENLSVEETLNELLSTTDSGKAKWLTKKLNETDPMKASTIVTEKLKTAKGNARVNLAGVLVQLNDPANQKVFTEMLTDTEPGLSNMAANYLAMNGNEGAVLEILKVAESNTNELTRRAMYQSIRRMKRPIALKGLVQCLEDPDNKIAVSANNILKEMTKQDFGFEENKVGAIIKWKEYIGNK